jgi:uncharacterized protein (DUF1330 family)
MRKLSALPASQHITHATTEKDRIVTAPSQPPVSCALLVRTDRRVKMCLNLKTTAAIVGSFMLGAGAIQALHAQSKPPAFVVAEVDVKDKAGFEENFLKAARKDISDHGGKYLAGGYNKTMSLVGSEPPNRVVILQFANMDAVKAWQDEGAMDMENTIGSKYAKFRIYAVEGATQ